MPLETWIGMLWREACHAPSLSSFVARITGPVPGGPTVLGITALAIDPQEGRVEAIGNDGGENDETGAGGGGNAGPAGLDLSSAQVQALSRWLATTAMFRLGADTPLVPPLQPLAEAFADRPCWLLPLPGEPRLQGLAVIRLADEPTYQAQTAAFLDAVKDPLDSVLLNDRRRHELTALRRAAEADKQSLLTRLGRSEVLEDIIGQDGGLRSVMQRVEMVAASDVPVLVLGETGSGKEVIARALHARSRRATGPFIRVNCGAIPSELVDSELFGHEKGSFTGAVSRRLGWFERADGGTLLLDEIGELPRAAQVRLLRVLQDGTLQRVGGETTLKVDVRVIAATHADLAGMVRTGEFREDLWYRLAVFPLLLPPLRDRRQDIPMLVEMLTRRAARRFGFRPQQPRPDDLALLLAYPWPGNVRELASVIDRAVILGEGRRLEIPKALGISTRKGLRIHHAEEMPAQPDNRDVMPFDEMVVRHLEMALTAARGRVEGPGGAAALLRLNANTLRSKLRKYGIDPRTFRK